MSSITMKQSALLGCLAVIVLAMGFTSVQAGKFWALSGPGWGYSNGYSGWPGQRQHYGYGGYGYSYGWPSDDNYWGRQHALVGYAPYRYYHAPGYQSGGWAGYVSK